MLDRVLTLFGLQDEASEVRTALLVMRAGEDPTPRQLATAVMSAILRKGGLPNDGVVRAALALERLSDEEFANVDQSVICTIDGTYIRLPEPGGRGRHYAIATMEPAQIDDSIVPVVGVVFNVAAVLAHLQS